MVCDTDSPNALGNSACSFLNRVDLPDPEGPHSTSGLGPFLLLSPLMLLVLMAEMIEVLFRWCIEKAGELQSSKRTYIELQ